jgi:hypothetical protein
MLQQFQVYHPEFATKKHLTERNTLRKALNFRGLRRNRTKGEDFAVSPLRRGSSEGLTAALTGPRMIMPLPIFGCNQGIPSLGCDLTTGDGWGRWGICLTRTGCCPTAVTCDYGQ